MQKFNLINMMLHIFITIISLFITLTQQGSMRQPAKLLIMIILVFSVISLVIDFYNYSRIDKD